MDNRHLVTRKIGRVSSNITLKYQHQAIISMMFTRFKRKELSVINGPQDNVRISSEYQVGPVSQRTPAKQQRSSEILLPIQLKKLQ